MAGGPAWWRLSWWRSSGWRAIRPDGRIPPATAVSRGTLASALLIVAAFLVNRNIFNSDNYRYLIFLLTPWALGFGLVDARPGTAGWAAGSSAWLIAGLLFAVMTSATFLWYRDERHYVDQQGTAPFDAPRPDWSELTVVPEVSPRDAGRLDGFRGSVGRDSRLRRILGRLPDGLPLRQAGGRHPVSDVSQSIPRLVARAGAGPWKAVDLASGNGFEEVGIAVALRIRGRDVVRSAQGSNWRSALATSG